VQHAAAKPLRMALGALSIKARMELTDEELVEQIKENPYLQFSIDLEAFHYSAPFDQLMMAQETAASRYSSPNRSLTSQCGRGLTETWVDAMHS
jgi:hypothetical protein